MANSPRALFGASIGILTCASVGYHFAEGKPLLDSVWWSLMTATTVGYGDTYPTTEIGRFIAVVLVGATLLFIVPMVTASLASKLIVDRNAFTHEEQEEIKEALRELLARGTGDVSAGERSSVH